MIAIVKTTYDRKTGEILNNEIKKNIDMTEDEYYESLVNILMEDKELQNLVQA